MKKNMLKNKKVLFTVFCCVCVLILIYYIFIRKKEQFALPIGFGFGSGPPPTAPPGGTGSRILSGNQSDRFPTLEEKRVCKSKSLGECTFADKTDWKVPQPGQLHGCAVVHKEQNEILLKLHNLFLPKMDLVEKKFNIQDELDPSAYVESRDPDTVKERLKEIDEKIKTLNDLINPEVDKLLIEWNKTVEEIQKSGILEHMIHQPTFTEWGEGENFKCNDKGINKLEPQSAPREIWIKPGEKKQNCSYYVSIPELKKYSKHDDFNTPMKYTIENIIKISKNMENYDSKELGALYGVVTSALLDVGIRDKHTNRYLEYMEYELIYLYRKADGKISPNSTLESLARIHKLPATATELATGTAVDSGSGSDIFDAETLTELNTIYPVFNKERYLYLKELYDARNVITNVNKSDGKFLNNEIAAFSPSINLIKFDLYKNSDILGHSQSAYRSASRNLYHPIFGWHKFNEATGGVGLRGHIIAPTDASINLLNDEQRKYFNDKWGCTALSSSEPLITRATHSDFVGVASLTTPPAKLDKTDCCLTFLPGK